MGTGFFYWIATHGCVYFSFLSTINTEQWSHPHSPVTTLPWLPGCTSSGATFSFLPLDPTVPASFDLDADRDMLAVLRDTSTVCTNEAVARPVYEWGVSVKFRVIIEYPDYMTQFFLFVFSFCFFWQTYNISIEQITKKKQNI